MARQTQTNEWIAVRKQWKGIKVGQVKVIRGYTVSRLSPQKWEVDGVLLAPTVKMVDVITQGM